MAGGETGLIVERDAMEIARSVVLLDQDSLLWISLLVGLGVTEACRRLVLQGSGTVRDLYDLLNF